MLVTPMQVKNKHVEHSTHPQWMLVMLGMAVIILPKEMKQSLQRGYMLLGQLQCRSRWSPASKIILQEFIVLIIAVRPHRISITQYLRQVMVQKTVKCSGTSRTHGALDGEILVTSRSNEVLTCVPSHNVMLIHWLIDQQIKVLNKLCDEQIIYDQFRIK